MKKFIILPLVLWPDDRLDILESWLKKHTPSFISPFRNLIMTKSFSLTSEDYDKFQKQYPRANFSGGIPRYDYYSFNACFAGFLNN